MIKLREMIKSDIEDYVRWFTVDTKWMLSDSPWNYHTSNPILERENWMKVYEFYSDDGGIEPFNHPKEIELDGIHIGFMCCYFDLEYLENKESIPGVGIIIPDEKYQNKGYGSKALELYLDIIKKSGKNKVFIQTWSGNTRMMRVCEKMNFSLYYTKKDYRIYNGKSYDALTYVLSFPFKPVIETERLILRKMTKDDFDSLKKVISDEETMKYYPKPYDDEGVRRWIDWCIHSYEVDGFGLLSLVLKETGEMIGDCGISMQKINGKMVPEIGYHLRKDYHKKGLGIEAARAVKDYFFENFDADEVYSYMTKENYPSEHLAMKNGMTFQNYMTDKDGTICKVYKITRCKWNLDKINR